MFEPRASSSKPKNEELGVGPFFIGHLELGDARGERGGTGEMEVSGGEEEELDPVEDVDGGDGGGDDDVEEGGVGVDEF